MRIEQEDGHWMVTGADIEGMKEKWRSKNTHDGNWGTLIIIRHSMSGVGQFFRFYSFSEHIPMLFYFCDRNGKSYLIILSVYTTTAIFGHWEHSLLLLRFAISLTKH